MAPVGNLSNLTDVLTGTMWFGQTLWYDYPSMLTFLVWVLTPASVVVCLVCLALFLFGMPIVRTIKRVPSCVLDAMYSAADSLADGAGYRRGKNAARRAVQRGDAGREQEIATDKAAQARRIKERAAKAARAANVTANLAATPFKPFRNVVAPASTIPAATSSVRTIGCEPVTAQASEAHASCGEMVHQVQDHGGGIIVNSQ
eukprot:7328334-Prymnesium_polylepis.1